MKVGSVKFEDLLQMGNHVVPEFDDFLPLWIEYLGKQSGFCASKLLSEAQSMVVDENILLENARNYVDKHPELYLQILQGHVDDSDVDKVIKIGLEALDSMRQELTVRSKIALFTANYANKLGSLDIRDKCWLEALKSDTSVVNYMRIKFLPENSMQYDEQIAGIINDVFEKSKENKVEKSYYFSGMDENSTINCLQDNQYCAMLFFEKEFERMKMLGMSVKDNLGWSSTFMKEGLALLLLLLYRGDTYQVGIRSMISRAMSACRFSKEIFYFGTDERNEQSDTDVFLGLFENWKGTVKLNEQEEALWIKRIDEWIKRRVAGIMEANRRNYYGECASFIAAFGEVKESRRDAGAKSCLLEHYKKEYSRRRAFHEELRHYGMKR